MTLQEELERLRRERAAIAKELKELDALICVLEEQLCEIKRKNDLAKENIFDERIKSIEE